jgi:formamidopyrimidine-DNA glycosylase
MPELPEVETIRRSLRPHLVGARVLAVRVRERRLRRPIAADLAAELCGARVLEIERTGKYLRFILDGERVLLVHLGMSGRLSLAAPDTPLGTHDHVVFAFDRDRLLIYNDPRRFGLIRLGRDAELTELARVGRDPLTAPPTAAEWRALVRGRRLPIKSLLMDQRALGGLGNIYVNEMLFRAGIRPRRRASGLRGAELARLAEAMAAVLEDAVGLGGSSISDYRDATGRPGSFQTRHAVYDRAGEPCPICASPIKRLVLGGRSTFYCARCQR